MQIQYFKVDGYDGDYFSCARYGTMAPASCVKNFKSAPDEIRRGRLEACIGCAIGQHHADPVAPPASTVKPFSFAYREVCVRCRRGGEADNNRLLGRIRLVREHTTCVSCVNREYEVLKGRNAKGAKPKKWRNLFFVQIGSIDAGRLTVQQFDHPVRDRLEAILTLLRRKQGPKVVAWTSQRSIQRMGAAL